MVEESTAAARELAHQTEDVTARIGRFQTGAATGRRHGPRPRPRARRAPAPARHGTRPRPARQRPPRAASRAPPRPRPRRRPARALRVANAPALDDGWNEF